MKDKTKYIVTHTYPSATFSVNLSDFYVLASEDEALEFCCSLICECGKYKYLPQMVREHFESLLGAGEWSKALEYMEHHSPYRFSVDVARVIRLPQRKRGAA
jgi:hypothetical protein